MKVTDSSDPAPERMPRLTHPDASPLGYASNHSLRNEGIGGRAVALLVFLVSAVVIVIGGGILAAWMPPWAHRSHQAKVAAAKQEIATLAGAIESFRLDTGRYPTREEGLAALRARPAVDGQSWTGPYLSHQVLNDPWGHPYIYRVPGEHNPRSFDVFSTGPSGQEGGRDNIGNW